MAYTRHVNQVHKWPDYGAKIKDNPTCDTVPITPNWAPLLIIRERYVVSLRVLVELPLELKRVTCTVSSALANWFWK